MTRNEIVLSGCTPEPLMNYLKALGVLRLVAEQKDPDAAGCWRNDVFVLRTTLTPDELVAFFRDEYAPTPLVAPWGGRSGFYAGSNESSARAALDAISDSDNPRTRPFREAIAAVHDLLRSHGITEKPEEDGKLRLLRLCRAKMPDHLMGWLDATYTLTDDSRSYPPILGTGGNEGSGSYVSNFAQQVVDCILRRKHDDLLDVALFGIVRPGSWMGPTPGHFSPAAAGGVNHGQGFESGTATCPWDYILCLEGTCLLASAVVRRCDPGTRGVAAFPFTAEPASAGSAGLCAKDETKPKEAKRPVAEMWLPTWSKPSTVPEVAALMNEGRASKGRSPARNGVDFARAVAALAVDRGIDRFHRHSFLMRNGQSFLAVPLGRFEVRARPGVDLIREADPWLDRFRRAASAEKAAPRFRAALSRIDRAVFDFCQYGGPTRFASILCALGAAHRELATAEKFREDGRVFPLAGLSPEWVAAAWDGSVEFELALALAGVFDPEGKVGPLRSNLEPVVLHRDARGRLFGQWAEKDRAVVWSGANLDGNLASVLERRVMDGPRKSCRSLPIAGRHPASLDAVAAFIARQTDDARVEELLWGLNLVDHGRSGPVIRPRASWDAPVLPRAYALLKLLFLPEPVATPEGEATIRPQSEIPSLLRSGRGARACAIAERRLRASGLVPLASRRGAGGLGEREWASAVGFRESRRLAAALLIPIGSQDVGRLADLVLRPAAEPEGVVDQA